MLWFDCYRSANDKLTEQWYSLGIAESISTPEDRR